MHSMVVRCKQPANTYGERLHKTPAHRKAPCNVRGTLTALDGGRCRGDTGSLEV